MSLLDIPMPAFEGQRRIACPLGKWPAEPSPQKREAQRQRAIAMRAKQREAKEAANA